MQINRSQESMLKSSIEEIKDTVESSVRKSQYRMIKQEAMFADMLHKTQESTTQTIQLFKKKLDSMESAQQLQIKSDDGNMTTILDNKLSLYEDQHILQNTIDELCEEF